MATSTAMTKDLDTQLTEVTLKILDFEALKLGELKSKLEALIKKKAAARKEYEDKFARLKEDWCAQNEEIMEIRQELVDAFKTPGWLELLRKCVCEPLNKKREQWKLVESRKGQRELDRDKKEAAQERARVIADGWENAAAKIRAVLDANKKTIDAIRAKQRSPERAFALYLMWFELLPAHASIRPVTDCFKVPPEDQTDYICPPDPPAAGATPSPPKPWPEHGDLWLIEPRLYPDRIDQAYDDYGKKKEEYADAQAAFAKDPDDVPGIRKKLDELTKSLRDNIEICLNGNNAKGCCDKAAAATP